MRLGDRGRIVRDEALLISRYFLAQNFTQGFLGHFFQADFHTTQHSPAALARPTNPR